MRRTARVRRRKSRWAQPDDPTTAGKRQPGTQRGAFRRTRVRAEAAACSLRGRARGDGALVMLAGEPGIGKTALCQQVAGFVGRRNGIALVGHCYPEGSASLPYQPFVEAFESYARQRDAEALRVDLGASASE